MHVKGTVSRDGYYFLFKHFNQYCLYTRWWFSRSFKCFSLHYTIINFLFASLKLLTNFENAYWNTPQNSLLYDWSRFSKVPTSHRLQGKCAKIDPLQAASRKHYYCQNRSFCWWLYLLVPGDGGSQIEARINRTDSTHWWCYNHSDWFDLWLNIGA
jgi:hypothetical protein